jgi:hypothetical protein
MHPSTICLPKDFFSFVEHANPINTYMGKFVGSSSDSFVSIFSFEMLVVGFFIVLVLPNSNSYLKKFSPRYVYAFFVAVSLMVFHFLQIGSSESIFLYFNF